MRALLLVLLFAWAGALGLEEGRANNALTEGPSEPQESDAVTLLEVERGSDSSKRGLGRKVGVVLPTSPRRQSEVGALMSELGELQQELQRVKTRSLAKKIVDEFDVNSDKMLGPMELEDAMNAGVLIAAHDA